MEQALSFGSAGTTQGDLPPFEDFLADLERLGVQRVAAGGRAHATFKARSNERWWVVPLDNRQAAASGLAMMQPVSRAARVGKAGARLLMGLGLPGAASRKRLRLLGLPEPCRVFGGRATACAYFTGTEGPHRKTAVQFMDSIGRILGYAKVSRKPQVRPFIANEARVLHEVASLRLRSAEVPTALAVTDLPDLAVLITDSRKTQRHEAPRTLDRRHLDVLAELAARTGSNGAGSLLDRIVRTATALQDSDMAPWVRRLRAGAAALRPAAAAIPVGLAHGDFTPWNCFLQDGRLYVFDWEYADPSYPLGYDLVHFRLSTAAGGDVDGLIDSLTDSLSEHVFVGARGAAERALLLSLLQHAAFYLRRGLDAGRVQIAARDVDPRAALVDRLLDRWGSAGR